MNSRHSKCKRFADGLGFATNRLSVNTVLRQRVDKFRSNLSELLLVLDNLSMKINDVFWNMIDYFW